MQSLREMYEERTATAIPRAAGPVDTHWHKCTITLTRLRDFAPIPWPAYVKEGLAVHYGMGHGGTTLKTWTITHIESGLCFPTSYHTRKEACEKVEQLLCIEGLWDNPLEAFSKGLRETDMARVNAILGTAYRAHTVSSDMKRYLEYRATIRGDNHVR